MDVGWIVKLPGILPAGTSRWDKLLCSESWGLFVRPRSQWEMWLWRTQGWFAHHSSVSRHSLLLSELENVTWDGSLQFFHEDPLRGHCCYVFLSPQLVNRHLYSGSADRTVKCWFVDTGERIQTYKAHKHSVSTLKYHAGICKLPFLCSLAPSSLLFNVCLWLKVINGE